MSTEAVAGRVVVGRYELIEMLGTGPMGPVWRAHDRRLQRQVAVREVELPDILDDAEQAALAEKVFREASAASQLDHPSAVTVLDVVTEAGQPFVVSELVSARTLADVVAATGPVPPRQVAAIGVGLLDALAAAHQLGLVHRDVRPSNVLLTETGVRLADFGVASMVDNPMVTGSAMHEPSYLAPEQTESAGATALSDLWSLGATLYFAVEGEPPFHEGRPTATIAAIVSQAPRPARRAGPLRPVLDALLVKDPMTRPSDAATRALLVAAAGTALDGPPLPPPATGPAAVTDVEPATPAPVVDDAIWAAPPRPLPADPVAWPDNQVLPDGHVLPDDQAVGDDHAPGDDHVLPDDHAVGDDHADGRAAVAPQDTPEAGAPADDDPALSPVATGREPWFFQVPVETVPGPPLPEPPPRPVVEPERPPGRFPRGLWAALLAALVAAVMIALIITGGRTLRAQRPTLETSKGPGTVSTWKPWADATTGFTIRYPPKWSVRQTGTQTFFVDPAGISYLEIDHQQPPAASLTASAFDQEKAFSASHPTYKRIAIDPTTYQDKPASLWQFTYADGGTDIRAVDLGVNGPKFGFALFFQAPAKDWARAQVTFDNFKSAFGIPS